MPQTALLHSHRNQMHYPATDTTFHGLERQVAPGYDTVCGNIRPCVEVESTYLLFDI